MKKALSSQSFINSLLGRVLIQSGGSYAVVMETKSAVAGGAAVLLAFGIAGGLIATANAQNAPEPIVTVTTSAPATMAAPTPTPEPVVTTSPVMPAPVVVPDPVVAPAPVVDPVPAPVVVEPVPVQPAPSEVHTYNTAAGEMPPRLNIPLPPANAPAPLPIGPPSPKPRDPDPVPAK